MIEEKDFNDIVTNLKKEGLLKEFKLNYKDWQTEVNKMEDNKVLQEQLKKAQEELDNFKGKERENLVNEYKELAEERKVKPIDVTQLSNDMIKLLTDQIKSMEVDLTQGKVGAIKEVVTSNIIETTQYGDLGTALLNDEGYIIARSDYGKWALTIDPSKIKPEGYRWRLFKNPSPHFT